MIKNYSRGAKHGRSQELYDHFKANESTRHAKIKFSSATESFQKDEMHRNSQLAIGWTEETMSVFGFSHAYGFLTKSYAERASAI